MKLIDLLVQELPKRGGWPDGATRARQSSFDTEIYITNEGEFVDHKNTRVDFGISCTDCKMWPNDVVTKEQYQSALAASQKVEWSGDGLPPVGAEFEYGTHRTKAKCIGIGHHMIFASKGNPDDEESDYEEFMISILDSEFYHARTDAQRKTDEALKMLELSIKFNRPKTDSDLAECIYDAIAAGKIPGVKLED